MIIILVNMSFFRYFGREKVKAVGDNNNLEATKKDEARCKKVQDKGVVHFKSRERLEDPG